MSHGPWKNLSDQLTRRPLKPIPPECNCRLCGIVIFRDDREAEEYGLPFYRTVNLAVTGLCIGCAGGDTLGPAGLITWANGLIAQRNANKEVMA